MTGAQCIMRDNSQKVNNADLCAKLWHGYNRAYALYVRAVWFDLMEKTTQEMAL